jgi:hypothetical protein
MTYAVPVVDLEDVQLEAAYGRPEQIAAWRDGTPYAAELAENSAGR